MKVYTTIFLFILTSHSSWAQGLQCVFYLSDYKAAQRLEDFRSVDLKPIDITSNLDPKLYEGVQISEGRWRLGEGSEAVVDRVQRGSRFVVEKTFDELELSVTNADTQVFLNSLNLQSFKTIQPEQVNFNKHIYPWVKGVSLDLLLSSPHISSVDKNSLWTLYKQRLMQMVYEMTSKHPDLDFVVEVSSGLNEVKQSISSIANLKVSTFIQKSERAKQRFMIDIFEKDAVSSLDSIILEPKPDNILVNLKTWEMTWVDPN